MIREKYNAQIELLHPYALECFAFARHLIHEASCFCVYFRPTLVAPGEHLRALLDFALAPLAFGTIFRHIAIVAPPIFGNCAIHSDA